MLATSNIMTEKRLCPVCGLEFEVKSNSYKIYCSKSCAVVKSHTGLIISPREEIKCFEICKNNLLPIRYTGNGAFWATIGKNHLNPDFKVNSQKKLLSSSVIIGTRIKIHKIE